jgi:hypothetical protein
VKATSPRKAAEPAIASSSEAKLRPLSERSERLAQKLEMAANLLSRVSPRSRDAQLLGIALLRRDESLLDELIARVQSSS